MNLFTEKESEQIIENSNDLANLYSDNKKIKKILYSKTIVVSANVYKIAQNPIVEYIEHYRNIYSSPENFIKRRVDYGRMKVIDEKLRKESERLKTLHSFPEHLKNLLKPISRSGFYSIANNSEPDKVKCIFCQGILQGWKKSDNPEKEHKKSFPTCPFLLNLNVGNEPLNESVKNTLTIDPDLQNIAEDAIPYDIVKPNENLLLRGDLDRDIDWRESTFVDSDNFKHFILQGLFVEKRGSLKFLKCHKCCKEVELLNDVLTLPETVFHMPDCYYIQFINEEKSAKNKQFKEISNGEKCTVKNKYSCIVEYSVTDDEIEARLDSRIRELENLHFNRSLVKEVIAKKLKSTGKDYESTFELLMDLKSFVKQEKMEVDINYLEFILPKNVCVVCLDQPIEVIFLPCGHLKTCKTCSNFLSSCPVCRQVIEKRVWGIRLGLKL